MVRAWSAMARVMAWLLGDGHHQPQVCLAQAAAGVQAVHPGLEQSLPPLVRQGAALHRLKGLLLFGGVLGGVLGALLVLAVLGVLGVLLLVVGGGLVLFKGEAGGVAPDVIGAVVFAPVGLQDAGRLGPRVDALAQLHLLLGRQQGYLADLL